MDRTKRLEALEAEYQLFVNQRDNAPPSKPRIAAWGLVKAGKSSLLNMLSGHASDEHFQTGDVRTTRTNQALELDNYVLVDTPGLGYDQNDTQQANQGLDAADVVLFVHAPPGELDQEEVALLDQLRSAFGQDVGERVVLVISQLDKLQDADLAAVKDTIERQALIHLGTAPECFVISNTRFKSGVEKNKQGLCEKSGIPQLAQHLLTLSKSLAQSLAEARHKRLARRALELGERIDAEIERDLKLIEQITEPYVVKAKAFVEHIDGARRTFKAHTSEMQKARTKLDSLK
ncbi:50S ribosome-binding GTPase [Pseudomonas sp. DCB_CB]|uniref:GTPase n=1 Tax=unclassified Pseudomonas TaxID=196821 RepID=UPI0015528406|nr:MULTISPECIES: GTPase [unclassified Pseudomonas]MCX2690934.1 50S ribosome-binding GTPase [Pseudomonas sp. DCB_BZ]MCX2856083.1 50S ribosome-binding GTPase [Pseudomonas sp. DCB_CB]NQD55170.1 GTPase [Pseudomonas sp. CM25]